jgi:tetratricopeptide (TPR) repeat protein
LKNRDGYKGRIMHHITGFAMKSSSILLLSILPFFYGCPDSSPPPQKESSANYQAEGKKLFSEGKSREAIEIWSKQLESNPRNVNALISIGIAHHELGSYQVALEYYNKALEINPNNPPSILQPGPSLPFPKEL